MQYTHKGEILMIRICIDGKRVVRICRPIGFNINVIIEFSNSLKKKLILIMNKTK